MRKELSTLLAAIATLALAACGGGGGGDNPGTTGSSSSASMAWNSYNANQFPDAANALTLASGETAGFSKNAPNGTDRTVVSGGVATFDTTSGTVSTDVDYRYKLPYTNQYPKKMTFLARVKAESTNTALRALAIEANFSDNASTEKTAGSRVKLAILGNVPISSWQGFSLENCDGSGSTPTICRSWSPAFSDILSYHVYHVSLTLTEAKKGYINVYVDGSETPVVSYGSASYPMILNNSSGTGANYIRFGDMDNSATHKSYIDWLIWTQDGAYSPLQLKGKMPANIGEIPAPYL